jgi:hypothetical protein
MVANINLDQLRTDLPAEDSDDGGKRIDAGQNREEGFRFDNLTTGSFRRKSSTE